MAAPWWRLALDRFPNAKVVTVRRPVSEIVDSIRRLGVALDYEAIRRRMWQFERKLDQIEARVPGVVSVAFDELGEEATVARVFEHCLPYKHDCAWWRFMAPLNLQSDFRATVRYCTAYAPALEKLGSTATFQTRQLIARNQLSDTEGMTFSIEPFDDFYRDGKLLFNDHSMRVGEHPASHASKNLPLMRLLDDMGAMQILTARSNGRMFGYLMTLLSPSLEAEHLPTGIQTLFYASPDVPGLGMRLQRESMRKLRERGIKEIHMRAGTRGSGSRISSMFRRLGAEKTGDLYMIDMKA